MSQPSHERSTRRTWHLLRPFIAGQRRKLVWLAVISTIIGFCEAGVLVLVVRSALLIADKGSDQRTKVPVIGAVLSPGNMLAIAAGLGLVSIAGHYVQSRLSAGLTARVLEVGRTRAIAAFANSSWGRQSVDREGALQETVSNLVSKTAQVTGNYTVALSAILNLATFLAIAALVDAPAMLAVMVFGAILAGCLRPLGRITQRLAQRYVETNSSFAEEVSRSTSLAMEYRIFGVEHTARQHLESMNRETARQQFITRAISMFDATLYRDLAALLLVGSVAGMYLVNGDAITGIGTVVVLVVRGLAYGQLLQSQLQIINEDGPNVRLFVDRVHELESHIDTFGSRPLDRIDCIELRNASYEYIPGVPALTDVSLRIEHGEILGIVGPSGGGKSTFVQVLLRLRPPQAGAVEVNGVPYDEFHPADWARLVTMVPQEPKLMQGTVVDNISFLRDGISRDEIEAAAEAARVADDIRKLPLGFDTELGARGTGLSGGQKQRVAIARALVGRPQLLVLDEPTSALDVSSERLLQATIESLKGSITMVIVAHRLSTLSVCDRLVVLEDGQLKMIGTPDELAQQPGWFRTISRPAEAATVPDPVSCDP